MPGRLDFAFNFARGGQPKRRDPAAPMRLLILADFSGDKKEEKAAIAERPILRIDIDNFDQVLARLAPRLHLPIGDTISVPLQFAELDDFHPDTLYRRMELFQQLRDLRKRLRDPATAQQAIDELSQDTPPSPAAADTSRSEPEPDPNTSTFERLLGGTPSQHAATAAPASGTLDGFIKSIVGDHVVAQTDAAQYIVTVDEAISEQMRALLQQPRYKALEANWRGLYWLVQELVTDSELELHLFDVSQSELQAELAVPAADLHKSSLYRRLVEQGSAAPDQARWSAIVASHYFGTDIDDLQQLAAFGALAHSAGGPVLAGAQPSLLACESLLTTPDHHDWQPLADDFEPLWQSLRASSVAAWIGLALPRVLLRLPYGAKTESIDSFEFEEQTPVPEHERYLWGNPAFACALLLGRTFLERGWAMEPGDLLDIDDLPAHTYSSQGESVMQACAETYLGERAAAAMLERGLIPLISYRNRNSVRVMQFRSLAQQATALAGQWA